MIAQDPSTHGSMLVPIIAGSDKTTVSVATGHQEYHPVYISPGNLTNTARRGHGNSVLPVAFLPIPKSKWPAGLIIMFNLINSNLASKRQAKRPDFQQFVRQLYHACLARVFAPFKAGMTKPEVVLCPDGHFRRAVYSLGPYIADYPEQVWLAAIVQGWCPKYVNCVMYSFTGSPFNRFNVSIQIIDVMRAPETWMTSMRTTDPMRGLTSSSRG